MRGCRRNRWPCSDSVRGRRNARPATVDEMMRGSPRVAVIMLAACVGLASVSVACGGAAAPRTLVDVGDSLAVGTHPYLADLLRDWELSSAAAVGRRSDEGLEVLRSLAPSLPRVV